MVNKETILVEVTKREYNFIKLMCTEKELSESGLFRQALRVYQIVEMQRKECPELVERLFLRDELQMLRKRKDDA